MKKYVLFAFIALFFPVFAIGTPKISSIPFDEVA